MIGTHAKCWHGDYRTRSAARSVGRLFGAGANGLWHPRDIQHRSGLPVYQRSLYWRAQGARHRHQHGRTWAGRGRALDNIFVERPWRSVKHEDVYLKGCTTITMPGSLLGLTEYFVFYNTERTHPSLNYITPDGVCRTAGGGGASVVDKSGGTEKPTQK